MSEERLEQLMRKRRSFTTRALVRLAAHYRQKTNNGIRAAGFPDFSDAHTQVLFNLEVGGNRITTLADRADITVQAMGKLVRDLESKGYVERAQDPTDGRAQIIRLTEKGLQFFEKATALIEDNEREMAKILGTDDFDALTRSLRSILREVDSDGF